MDRIDKINYYSYMSKAGYEAAKAEIEAGNVQKPNPEKAVSKLEFHGLEGYWYGYWIEEYTWTPNGWQGYQYEGAGRFTERFPYANKD